MYIDKLKKRAEIVRGIREHFYKQGYWEVETPLLLPTVSTEPNLEVFETELRDDQGNKWRRFLPTSPEYAMKKMLSAGSGSIFQLTSSFRNEEGISPKHSAEFSILEWYEVGGDYMSVVNEFERLLLFLNKGESKLRYQGKEYEISSPWEKISVAEAFYKYAGVNEEEMLSERLLKIAAEKKGYQVREDTTWEEVWNQIIANEIEPKLGEMRPTVLYDYPMQQGAYAKAASDPRYAERAEIFLAGIELGNIFSELIDWQEQKKRCEEDLVERKRLGKTEYPQDDEFIEALRVGMPETGGIAVGVDRLVMLLTDTSEIEEIRL